jgi:hypothetical protein
MPDVTGKKLDDAKSAIKDAGFDDEIKVDGGGLFGVVVASNWEVCRQNPAAGTTVAGKPTLTVARSCGDDKSSDGSQAKPSETAPATTEETAPAEPQAVATLTPRNTKNLAAMLVEGDSCDAKNAAFAKKYAGRTIAFDGSIAGIAPHGSDKTRYDILIGPGDKGPNTTKGPSFQFRNVNMFDLNLRDRSVDLPAEGEKFRFIAEVGEFNPDQCLFFLKPVKTIPR